MSRTRTLSVITLMAIFALTACASDEADDTAAPVDDAATTSEADTPDNGGDTAVDASDFTYVLVTPGAVGDESFTDSAVRGTVQADAELGVTGKVIEALTTAEQETSLRAAVEQNPNIVLGLAMEADTMLAIADQFPDQLFGVPSDIFADVLPANMAAYTINVHEGSFLAGVVAGSMTQTNTVAAVVGGDSPALNQFYFAYRQGVHEVCPDCEVLVNYLNFEFGDPNLGKESALSLISQGADIVFAVAGQSGLGVHEAAVEAGVYSIGVDSNQDGIAPGTVITSMMKRTDTTTFLLIQEALNGEFNPGFTQLSLVDDAVGLSWDSDNSTVFAENGPAALVDQLPTVQGAVADYKAQILAGSLEICDALNAPDTEVCTAATS